MEPGPESLKKSQKDLENGMWTETINIQISNGNYSVKSMVHPWKWRIPNKNKRRNLPSISKTEHKNVYQKQTNKISKVLMKEIMVSLNKYTNSS